MVQSARLEIGIVCRRERGKLASRRAGQVERTGEGVRKHGGGRGLSKCCSLLPQLVWGSLAFLIYEVSIGSLMSYLDEVRPVSVFFLELLVFALAATAMVLYSRVLALETERGSFSSEETLGRHHAERTRFESRLSEKLETLSGGIEHSLSAIMFFARAQLAKAPSPQMERDLREVMERIDQIQFF